MRGKKYNHFPRLKDFYNSVTLSGLKDRNDLEQLRKILLLHLTILTGGTLLYSLSAIVFFEGIPLLAIIDFLTATFLVSIRVYPKKTNDYICAKNDGMGSTFSFTLPI